MSRPGRALSRRAGEAVPQAAHTGEAEKPGKWMEQPERPTLSPGSRSELAATAQSQRTPPWMSSRFVERHFVQRRGAFGW